MDPTSRTFVRSSSFRDSCESMWLDSEDAFSINSYTLPGMVLTNLQFTVPLDWENPDNGENITVFVRKVVAVGNEKRSLPYLLYLQGGPGFPSPRPEGKYGWLRRATDDFQVLLLDQRGTGLSSPINYQTLEVFLTAHEQATYLAYFRADSIVKDCEFIREKLLGIDTWVVLGQSFGGFCLTHYLSVAPYGIKSALFTGGIPPIFLTDPDTVYRYTFKKVIEYNKLYYQRYPEDIKQVKKIISYLRTNKTVLPSGGVLTVRRFLQIGLGFGLGAFERVHYLLESAFVRIRRVSSVGYTNHVMQSVGADVLSFNFLRGIENIVDFETNPLYAVLQESIYCQGKKSNWSADRISKEFPEFSLDRMQTDEPILFTGEMIFPWMFDDYKYLQPIKMAAEMIAKKDDWKPLYNLQQLRENRVPSAAIIYYDDMYVPRELSEEAAKQIGLLQVWVTNEYVHSGIYSAGDVILSKLLGMVASQVANE